ncbi:LysR family transcriptional regulator [Paraburkholderia sacchari]|uniref:LysR family transcriptional regulator n=1 Tax=Paraburkholderia sacchari TaxID=159450 RepID=UPI0005432918|nr:LysR family transcriptional regulator [Paraburkholderia sacchari]NLP63337.1 LysR family transcriptional regulator [Paraburkholderia sacchari]
MNILEAMRIYILAVERGSISGAASDANIGQPAASERIERLEKYLGCRLLLRNARTFKCTPEGEVFYAHSKKILADAEQAIAEVRSEKRTLRETIRIAAPYCMGELLLPCALRFVREACPQLDIDLALNDGNIERFAEGVDLWLHQGPVDDGPFHALHFGQVRRILVASPDYLAQHEPIKEPGDLAGHAFIRIKSMFGTSHLPLVDESARRDNVPIRTSITTNHWKVMYQMIKGGLGIGVVEAFACADAIARGELVPLLPQHVVPSQQLHLLIRVQRPVPMRVRTVADILKQRIPDLLGAQTGDNPDRTLYSAE